MTHTKGPWQYKQRGTQIWGRSVGGCRLEESNHLIADVRGWGHIQYLPNGKDVQDANGRLIAAAPELLEALKNFISQYKTVHGIGDMEMQPAIDFAHKTIAKATGAA